MFNIEDIANNFIRWYDDGFCSSLDCSFDVGTATVMGIHGLKRGELRNGFEDSQGNGSIMRFSPSLLFDNGDTGLLFFIFCSLLFSAFMLYLSKALFGAF